MHDIKTITTYFSSACSIEVPQSDRVVITGGMTNTGVLSRVQVYSTKGATQQLPALQQKRWGHACGYYFDGNKIVSNSNLKSNSN